MIVELHSLFSGDIDQLPLDITFDMSQVDIGGYLPLSQPARFIGSVYNRSGVITLEGVVSCEYSAPCDRCSTDCSESVSAEVLYYLSENIADEEKDDYAVVVGRKLEVDSLVCTDLLLALPTKHLCKEDCKGLCSNCGADLNNGKCACSDVEDNPFAQALKSFFD